MPKVPKIDGLVKSLQGCHSRERGSPEVIDFPGFPRSRGWQKGVISDFLRVCQTLVYSQIIRNKCIGEFLLNPPGAEKSIKEVEKMKK